MKVNLDTHNAIPEGRKMGREMSTKYAVIYILILLSWIG